MTKNSNVLKIGTNRPISNSFYICLTLITIGFITTWVDPINMPKFLILGLLASLIFIENLSFLEFLNIRKVKSRVMVLNLYSLIFFVGLLLISALFTNSFHKAFLGETQRQNGFLTYLFLSVIYIYLVLNFTQKDFRKFFNFIGIISLVVFGYGILQILHRDFVGWTTSGGIFSTLGNSNFAGVVFVILLLLNISAYFNFKQSFKKYFYLPLILSSVICIRYSNARQAMLSFVIATIFISIPYFYSKSRVLGRVSLFLTIPTMLVISIGIFNHGPLSSYLYKGTIKVRQFYWEASINMFLNKPFIGVGIDSYGDYFKEFRDKNYPLNYGWDLTSTNAHNVFLQFLSTAGIFVTVAYLLFVVSVTYLGFSLIRKLSVSKKSIYTLILGGWLVYVIQSLVSIDNVGISIWGWTCAGLLVAGFREIESEVKPNSNHLSPYLKLLLKPLITIPVLVMALFVSQVQSNVAKIRFLYKPTESSTTATFIEKSKQVLSMKFLDPDYRTNIGAYLLDYGQYDDGLKILTKSLRDNPRDLYALGVLARYYESTKNFEIALEFRIKIEKYDPWNAQNLYMIILNYNQMNNLSKVKEYAAKIRAFAQESDIGLQLSQTFPNL